MKTDLIIIITLLILLNIIIIRQYLIIKKLDSTLKGTMKAYTNCYKAYQDLYFHFNEICDIYRKTFGGINNVKDKEGT